jgi:hypothetical protein
MASVELRRKRNEPFSCNTVPGIPGHLNLCSGAQMLVELGQRKYGKNVAYFEELAKLWREEHDAVLKEVRKISRRMNWEIKNYGQVQKETLDKIHKLGRKNYGT